MAAVDREALIARYRALRARLDASGVRLIAVSKSAPEEAVAALIAAGCADFGESRPQALRDRAQRFAHARWHQIGPVQRNTAKYVAAHAAWWHTAADVEVARAVARRLSGRRLPTLVQVNLADAPHRHGVRWADAPRLVEAIGAIDGIDLRGLMGMAPKGGDPRPLFARLRRLRDALLGETAELCIGMSGDWRQAVDEGATMVRIGRALFGAPDETARIAAREAE